VKCRGQLYNSQLCIDYEIVTYLRDGSTQLLAASEYDSGRVKMMINYSRPTVRERRCFGAHLQFGDSEIN